MQAVNQTVDTRKEVLEIVRTLPGVDASEIITLMPHVSRATVYCALTKLKAEGVLIVDGKKQLKRSNGAPYWASKYVLNPSPNPSPTSNVVKMKRRAPTEVGVNVQMQELKARIAELEAWKRDAIARYPDLAVAPVVLKARKIVADEVRAGGDRALADHVMAGHKDDTLMVRVTIKALEEAE